MYMDAVAAVGDFHRGGVEHVRRDARLTLELRVVSGAIVLGRHFAAALGQKTGILFRGRSRAGTSSPDPEKAVRRFFGGPDRGGIEGLVPDRQALVRPEVLPVAGYVLLAAGQEQVQQSDGGGVPSRDNARRSDTFANSNEVLV